MRIKRGRFLSINRLNGYLWEILTFCWVFTPRCRSIPCVCYRYNVTFFLWPSHLPQKSSLYFLQYFTWGTFDLLERKKNILLSQRIRLLADLLQILLRSDSPQSHCVKLPIKLPRSLFSFDPCLFTDSSLSTFLFQTFYNQRYQAPLNILVQYPCFSFFPLRIVPSLSYPTAEIP